MKRSSDETARARYEDALRHQGRQGAARAAAARHVSRRHSEHSSGEAAGELNAAELSRSRAGLETRLERRAREEREGDNPGSARLQLARQRRERQKMRATTLLLVIPTTAFSLMLMAMAHVVFRDWRSYESEASIAHAQLSALQEQLDTGQRRLSSLRSPKGREQILVEHGFIRPGDRMLLFPAEAASKPGTPEPSTPEASTSRTQSDIAARRAIHNAAPASPWDRAARAMTGWLDHFSGSQPEPAPNAAPDAAASTSLAPQAANATAASSEADAAISPADRIVRPRDDAAR